LSGPASRLFSSPRAEVRRTRALSWLGTRKTSERVLLLGATSESSGELLREALSIGIVQERAVFGWQRLSLMRLASTLAAPELARRGLVPIGGLSLEALCARLLHEDAATKHDDGGAVFDASLPGAARALAKTLGELRLAGISPRQTGAVRPELGRLLQALEASLARGKFADRALVLSIATEHLASNELAGHAVLLLDVPISSQRESELISALADQAEVIALVPDGDSQSLTRLAKALSIEAEPLALQGDDDLARLQQRLFVGGLSQSPKPKVQSPQSLEIFSAPGEGRECVEIVRRVLAAASRGVPFDRMAVLLRQPGLYRPLLEEALARAEIPAYFAKGTSRPDPAGRAFLALLACADEGLSARRFAEYLSLGQVPEEGAAKKIAAEMPAGAHGEFLAGAVDRAAQAEAEPGVDTDSPARASWRWEPLIIDSAVIGGHEVDDAKARWARRLAGYRVELLEQEEAYAVEEEARALGIRKRRGDLDELWKFAEPLLARLSALPREARWGEWLAELDTLAVASLKDPDRVRALLGQLQPIAAVGPVSLSEVQLLLSRELSELPVPPSPKRAGKLFVGPIEAARGHSFQLVFTPGLAERLFPPKALQDPLLRDRDRQLLDASLPTEAARVSQERLQLRLAAGAAETHLVLSWPRLELQLGRARVPSFYALEALAAAEGVLPGFAELSRRAEKAGDARAGWPAPRHPKDAIDAAEHDLSLLGEALHRPEAETKGIARYLLGTNAALKRALHRRAARPRRKWFTWDGLVDPSREAIEALKKHQLDARSFSASALQNYSACPYRFLLQAIHRLEPREEPQAIDEIDPMSRGSLMHDIQFELFNELRAERLLPLYDDDADKSKRRLDHALGRLDAVASAVAGRYRDDLAPAIARVWEDCVASIQSDLREWLRRVSQEPRWSPFEFERAFGLTDRGARDAHSQTAPVLLGGGLQLRGSIDLVERDASGNLRATDYKSGRRRAEEGVVIKGGEVLQPMLYALALEQLFPDTKVVEGTLYYCTHTGEYAQIPVPLDRVTRESELLLAKTLGGALRDGFFPAAPRAGECQRCDYADVCGEGEEQRVLKKPQERLLPLHTLRGAP
jgi:ATP-dependent helicase/nuclease subunit B